MDCRIGGHARRVPSGDCCPRKSGEVRRAQKRGGLCRCGQGGATRRGRAVFQGNNCKQSYPSPGLEERGEG